MADELFSDVASPTTTPEPPTPGDDRAAAVRATAARTRTRPPGPARPPGRAPTAKKPAARKASKPAATTGNPAKGKQTAGGKVAEFVATGAAFWSIRSPIKAAVLIRQAATLGPVLDGIAAENKTAALIIERAANMFAVGGAWGEAGVWAGQTAAAMVLASGAAPAGLPGIVLAAMGGALLDQSLTDAAERAAAAMTTDDQPPTPELIETIRAEMVDSIKAAAMARAAAAEDGEGAGDDD